MIIVLAILQYRNITSSQLEQPNIFTEVYLLPGNIYLQVFRLANFPQVSIKFLLKIAHPSHQNHSTIHYLHLIRR